METYKLSYDGDKIDETLKLTNDESKGNEALKTQLDANTTKVTKLSTDVQNLHSQVLTTDSTLKTEIQDRSKADNSLRAAINNKQDILKAGTGITISNNVISADGGAELEAEIEARKEADSKLQTNINTLNSALNDEVTTRTKNETDIKTTISSVASNYQSADKKLQENIDTLSKSLDSEIGKRVNADSLLQINIDKKQDKLTDDQLKAVNSGITSDLVTQVNANTTDIATKVSKSGDTMTGKLTVPQVETGTGDSNYFQSRKFRGEGDASTYYHALDYGYAEHNQVDWYEYGGEFNFWKNTSSTATTDASNKVASLQLGKLVERGNELTYPGKSGTIALTSDVDTKQDILTAGDNIVIKGNVISAIGGGSGDVTTKQLEEEIDARKSADSTLQSNIDTINTNLTTEITRATSKESDLTDSISDLNTKLTDEIESRQVGDSSLLDKVNKKQDKLIAGTGVTIEDNIINVDTSTLATKEALQEEHDDRIKQEGILGISVSGLNSELSDEISRATTRENEIEDSLTTNVSTLQSNIDTLSTSKQDKLIAGDNITIVNNVISASGDGEKGYVTEEQLKAEATLREYADNALSTKITGIEDTYQTKLYQSKSIKLQTQTWAETGEVKVYPYVNENYIATQDWTQTKLTNYRDELNTSINKKQDKLTDDQLNAVNSGITSDLVTQIKTNTTNIAKKQDTLIGCNTTITATNNPLILVYLAVNDGYVTLDVNTQAAGETVKYENVIMFSIANTANFSTITTSGPMYNYLDSAWTVRNFKIKGLFFPIYEVTVTLS